jgi:3-methyladenine DNA glycosylase AlkD
MTSNANVENDFNLIYQLATEYADESKAPAMEAYMKGHFKFLGLTAPQRKLAIAEYKKVRQVISLEDLLTLVGNLWENQFREMQHIAMDLLAPYYKKMDDSHLSYLENLITTKSWWDTVDNLASNGVGKLLYNNKALTLTSVDIWMQSDNIWLKRTAIIFQLKYKDEVNEALLFDCIMKEVDNKEFFIQKACGWALRQYSKFKPANVTSFLDENPNLSNLCKREASKYLN